MKKAFFLMLTVLVFVSQVAAVDEPIGIVVNSNTNSFQFIDPINQQVSTAQLKGYMGSYGGGLFDVVITPDGKKAVISNFGDSKIFVIDISGGFYGNPQILGEVYIPFFAEDLEITPDGKYVLVTDGGFTEWVVVVDIDNLVYVNFQNLEGRYANAVAIAPNGRVVLLADYFGGAIHSYILANDGSMTYVDTKYILPMRSVNIAIFPDSHIVIAANAGFSSCPIFALDEDGYMTYTDLIPLTSRNGQSCVFSKDGTKAYYYSTSQNKPPRIHVLKVTGPGIATYDSYIDMSISRGTSQLFGVDTIAIDPSGNYLYVANPTLSGGVVEVGIVNIPTQTEVNSLKCIGIPTGLCFATISDEGGGSGE
jgi:DNA-binding beta-propeller fold protein YncE